MSLRCIVLPLVIIASVDASYMMKSTGVATLSSTKIGLSHKRAQGTLISAMTDNGGISWPTRDTKLVLNKDGGAVLENRQHFSTARDEREWWEGNVYRGSWSEVQPGHFTVALNQSFRKKDWNVGHKTTISPPVTVRAVVGGSKVQLFDVQHAELHFTSLSVYVSIGSGNGPKCINSGSKVACAKDAGDKGKRLMTRSDRKKHPWGLAKDSFEITVSDGTKVCAKRTDNKNEVSPPGSSGWGLNLQIPCALLDYHAVEPLPTPQPTPEPMPTPQPTPEPIAAHACTRWNSKNKLHHDDLCWCHMSAMYCRLCGGSYRKGVRPPAHCSP